MIDVKALYKSFQNTQILTDLTFYLEAGTRLALLGANGSGKTLLLRMLATLVKPTSGSIEIAGYDAIANVHAVRPLIGYVPEIFDGYPDFSVQEYLEFFADAYKLGRSQRSTAIQDVLDLMDLTALRVRQIKQLSLGQKRRLCLAKTFLHDPLVWLLDAPIAALDLRGQTEMSALIEELAAMGKTIILTTNQPADATATCNHVGILNSGKLVFYGEVANLSQSIDKGHQLEIEVTSGVDVAQSVLEKRSDLTALELSGRRIQVESQMSEIETAKLLTDLIHAGVTVLRFQRNEGGLEDLFLEMTQPEIGDAVENDESA